MVNGLRITLMGRGKHYTEEEDVIIRKYSAYGTPTICQFLPHRNANSIQCRAKQILGIEITREDEWSQDELDILKRNYVRLGRVATQKLLKRSLLSVSRKAYELGLITRRRNHNWTAKEIQILKDKYPNGGLKEVRKYIDLSDDMIMNKARKLGIRRNK